MSMSAAPHLIEVGEIEVYPIATDHRLSSHYFTKWWHDRWLNSVLHLTASYEVQGIARTLFDLAQKQAPVGTLPDDDLLLSRLLRLDLAHWRDLRRREPSPLHNWRACLSDTGERRLMHPVVTEVALDAINRTEAREAAASEKAVKERKRRLSGALRDLGCSDDVVADTMLVDALDGWLVENCRGNRTTRAYQRALEWAAREKLFGRGDKALKTHR